MERKTAIFKVGNRSGEVAYVILKETVYFTQTSGITSSINAAEEIVEAISIEEKQYWKEYKWVDIQTSPRFSEPASDILVFYDSESCLVAQWNHVEIPEEVTKILFPQ